MNPAATPEPVADVQGDGRWISMHERFCTRAKDREPEVLFIGDSLIQSMQNYDFWEKMCVPMHSLNFGLYEDETQHILWRVQNGELENFEPKFWEKMFVPMHCLNFGVGGDATQHILWRVQNGELENFSPKVIVLLCGTNNHGHNAEQVAEGIVEIVKAVQEKQPQAQIIVVGIPPRGQKPNKLREKIAQINSSLEELIPKLENVQFSPIDPSLFIQSDGTIDHHDMYDYLHFTKRGYLKFVEPLCEEIQSLLKNFLTADAESDAGSTAPDL